MPPSGRAGSHPSGKPFAHRAAPTGLGCCASRAQTASAVARSCQSASSLTDASAHGSVPRRGIFLGSRAGLISPSFLSVRMLQAPCAMDWAVGEIGERDVREYHARHPSRARTALTAASVVAHSWHNGIGAGAPTSGVPFDATANMTGCP